MDADTMFKYMSPDSILAELVQRIQRRSSEAMLELTQLAMQLEAPDIAQLGFEAYRAKLARDTEGPDYTMVMLEREVGQPYQPIVLFIQDFNNQLSRKRAMQMEFDITPVLGEKGWQQFQRKRSMNNMLG